MLEVQKLKLGIKQLQDKAGGPQAALAVSDPVRHQYQFKTVYRTPLLYVLR